MPVNEASSAETPYGRYITSEGWFVLNLAEALAVQNPERGGAAVAIEPREFPFSGLGVNLRVIPPGQPSCYYHSENQQEGFLVLAGECTLIVEEEERQLRQWDYFHCPPDTRHVFVGAGDEPCVVFMVSNRLQPEELLYPASEVAAKYGASAAKATAKPDEAYADWPGEFEPTRLSWPLQ